VTILKLIALDYEDLEIIAAHVQDSVVKIKDISWLVKDKRFIVPLKRFAWEEVFAEGERRRRKTTERHLTVLRFDRVLSVKAKGLNGARPKENLPEALQSRQSNKKTDILSLLTIRYEHQNHGPEGLIYLIFSGQATIRLEVECIEAELRDLGPVWQTGSCPKHL